MIYLLFKCYYILKEGHVYCAILFCSSLFIFVVSFLFSGLISIMSTDRGTIIRPHISPTSSIDTDSKKPVINLVQYFPEIRAFTDPSVFLEMIIQVSNCEVRNSTVCPKKKDYLFLNARNSLKNC